VRLPRLVLPIACFAAALPLAAHAQTPAQTPGSVKVDGMVQAPQSFTADQLKSLPSHQVDAAFQTMHGSSHHVWTGVLLWDLVNKPGLKDAPGPRTGIRHTFLIRGADGYAAALAIGEIDPAMEGKPVILAYLQDNQPTPLRLIVPADHHGARDVHDVVEIEVR
jgi:DMSO/TMAO reductase YedYZ molybdopterin-dependent catalytic subunit